MQPVVGVGAMSHDVVLIGVNCDCAMIRRAHRPSPGPRPWSGLDRASKALDNPIICMRLAELMQSRIATRDSFSDNNGAIHRAGFYTLYICLKFRISVRAVLDREVE